MGVEQQGLNGFVVELGFVEVFGKPQKAMNRHRCARGRGTVISGFGLDDERLMRFTGEEESIACVVSELVYHEMCEALGFREPSRLKAGFVECD